MVKNRKFKTVFVWAVVLLLGFCFSGVAAASDKPMIWRLQSAWATSTGQHPAFQKMCDMIKQESNGRLEIKLFGPGEIVGTVEMFDAVVNGVLEMAGGSGIYNSGKIPEGLVEFGMPFALENKAELDDFWLNYKGGEAFKIVQEAYRKRGAELLAIHAGNSYGYMTAFPATTAAEFKGKKIRSFGFFGSIVQMMGGQPVSLPTEDQYLALQQGTVDGTIFPYLAMQTMNLKEVAKHAILPPVLGSPTSDVYVSSKAWAKLPEDIKPIVIKYVRLQNEWYMAKEYPQEQEMLANPDEFGIEVHRMKPEEVTKLKAMGQKIWDGVAKRSEGTAKLIDMLRAYKAEKQGS